MRHYYFLVLFPINSERPIYPYLTPLQTSYPYLGVLEDAHVRKKIRVIMT